jgi:hypothetical protein
VTVTATVSADKVGLGLRNTFDNDPGLRTNEQIPKKKTSESAEEEGFPKEAKGQGEARDGPEERKRGEGRNEQG